MTNRWQRSVRAARVLHCSENPQPSWCGRQTRGLRGLICIECAARTLSWSKQHTCSSPMVPAAADSALPAAVRHLPVRLRRREWAECKPMSRRKSSVLFYDISSRHCRFAIRHRFRTYIIYLSARLQRDLPSTPKRPRLRKPNAKRPKRYSDSRSLK